MTFKLDKLVRPNILGLKSYSSARSEFAGTADVFLDANENAFGSPAGDDFNRYPDPLQGALKKSVSEMNLVAPSQIFIGNGSDEAIDLLFRIFCEPGRDECVICPPTYGMYRVSADINDVSVNEVRLTDTFQLDLPSILQCVSPRTKLIFVCSPNNPTGNLMDRADVVRLAREFDGIVIVDEAYIHFSDQPSMIGELERERNIVVLQTFSKAWGMAGMRVGLAFGSESIIDLMNRVKPPYNVGSMSQRAVLAAIEDVALIDRWKTRILTERKRLIEALAGISCVEAIYPSDANFILVKTTDATAIYRHLIHHKVVVRDRSGVKYCENCLRITVGNELENDRLIKALESY